MRLDAHGLEELAAEELEAHDPLLRIVRQVFLQEEEVVWQPYVRVAPEDLVNLGGLAPHIDGLDRMRQVAAQWSPERVATVTKIDAERAAEALSAISR